MNACRIFVVEDDPVLSAHLETIITDHVRSDVIVSPSIREAELSLKSSIDFAFLDVDVLDGTTYDLAFRLRTKAIPFAFVSASKREAMPPGLRAAPFVAKPYADHDIIGLLHAAKVAGWPTCGEMWRCIKQRGG